MNWAPLFIFLSAVSLLLIPLPAVNQNEWLPPDIVRDVAQISGEMRSAVGGQDSRMPKKDMKVGGEEKRNAGPVKK